MNIRLVNLKMCKFSTYPQELCTPYTLGEIKKNIYTFFAPGDLVLLPFDSKEQTNYEQFYLQYKRELVEKTANIKDKILVVTGFHLPVNIIMEELTAIKLLSYKGVVLFLYKFGDEGIITQSQELFSAPIITLGYNEFTKVLEIQNTENV